MKKWQNLAAPDDPDSYYDVDGVWPTDRGTYETADFLSGTEYTATAAASPILAFAAQKLNTTTVEYVIDGAIWQYSAGAFTDRTGTAVVQSPMMAQYGNVTIGAMGGYKSGGLPGRPTVYSTGGNFAVLAAAPQADIVAVAANAVGLFNQGTGSNEGNKWSFSDVGDYTNWTTGEATSGSLIQTPGDITAAVPFGNDMIVFKANSIYRMRYVGGLIKWTSELVVSGVGCAGKHCIAVGATGILFLGVNESATYKTTNPTLHMHWFDGVSFPRLVNPMTALTTTANPSATFINYDPRHDLFSVVCQVGSAPFNRTFFYCPSTDMWGKNDTPITNTQTTSAVPVMADFYARPDAEKSPMPTLYNKESADKLKRYTHGTPIGEIASACYVETAKIGKVGRKTLFSRVTPRLRRRIDLGTDSATLTATLFRELHDTSAATTRTGITEATNRKRFDLLGGTACDNFARFKAIFTALDVEIDDLEVMAKDAGED